MGTPQISKTAHWISKKIYMHDPGMLLNASTKFHPNRMKKINPGDNGLNKNNNLENSQNFARPNKRHIHLTKTTVRKILPENS
jgi:hypothetical protein